jgi:hypothetical protein
MKSNKKIKITESQYKRLIKEGLSIDSSGKLIDSDPRTYTHYKERGVNSKEWDISSMVQVDGNGQKMLVFNDIELDELPDLSSFDDVDEIFAINCGLNMMPPVEHLPKSLKFLSLKNNNIRNADMWGYSKLTELSGLVLYNNPLEWLNGLELSSMNLIILRIGRDNQKDPNWVHELDGFSEYYDKLLSDGVNVVYNNIKS